MSEWDPKQAVDLILKQSPIVNGLWQNYATISSALIAFSVAAGKDVPSLGRLGACAAFLVFAWGKH